MIKTVGLSEDLAERLVDIILEKAGNNPLEMAKIQVVLPTRRACKTVKDAFLQKSKEKSLLLPQLMPIYELDNLAEDIPTAMPALERTLLLAKMCHKKPHVSTPEQAIKIAVSLGELLDEFYQFETDTTQLSELVQNPIFAEHWNETLIFLEIITQQWPKILKEKGLIDEADRRIRLIDAYTKKIQGTNDTVIVAGLDGGLPAVRRLLETLNKQKNGLILLDGVDTGMTSGEMELLPEYHYQTSIKQILTTLKTEPSAVQVIGHKTERETLIREALLPESRTEEWRAGKIKANALQNVERIDCETSTEEALTIALILREALEKPEQTAALVTTDRLLARRVMAEMKRWGIILDDSAGTPITQTPIGVFLGLLTDVALTQGKPSALLALLKHPFSADGQNPMAFRQTIKSLEKEVRLNKTEFNPNLKTDFNPFISLFQNNVLTPFKTLLTEHIRLAEELATSADRTAQERLWQDDAGKATFDFLINLLEKADLIGEIEPLFYPNILEILMNTVTVRPTYGMHPRLDILGPIEARFNHYDICVLGGLNEGTFPTVPDVGPWLNRPMRYALNLPQPESKTATVSMDFAHCFCSPKVILTRAKKAEGAETIPSRFLARIEAALTGSNLTLPIKNADWAKRLDKSEATTPSKRPQPCPPVDARPKSLSVTKIELWMRNPYAIYARYILRLFKLDPLENNQKQQIYGSAVHKILEKFIKENPNNCDKNRLMTLADEILTEFGMTPTDKIFYLPRFEQTAEFIIKQQHETQGMIKASLTEEKAEKTFDVAGHPFTLKGTADRIDILKDGTARILDYKTGTVPSVKEVVAGYAPQLPLESYLFSNNGFPEQAKPVAQLAYWKLASKEADCHIVNVTKDKTAQELSDDNFENLKTLIYTYNQEKTPYAAAALTGRDKTYNDYDHLARTSEWANEGDEE